MTIKITIDNREVKNPLVKFLIAVVGAIVVLVGFCLVLFLVLSVVWIVGLFVMLIVLTALVRTPRFLSKYKIIFVTDKTRVNDL
jgi:hypothetical protein